MWWVPVHMWYEGMVMLRHHPPQKKRGSSTPGWLLVGEGRDLLDPGHWSSAAACPRVTRGIKS